MTVRLAIIGYGSSGRQHVQALDGVEKIEPYCVLDSNPDVDTGSLHRKNSWEEVLNDPEVDAVALCLPPGIRGQMAHEALVAGKAVLLEKPPCTSELELDSLLSTAQETNRSIGVMFQHRYRIPIEALNITWDHRTTAVLQVSRPRDPERYFRSWRKDPDVSGGGIFAHLGIHYMDLSCQLLGLPVTYNELGRREFAPGLDVRLTGSVEFSCGATMAFTITGEAASRCERLDILGGNARLTIEDGRVVIEADGEAHEFVADPTTLMRKRLYTDFANAVEHREQPKLCHLDGSRGVTRLLESMRHKVQKV